MPANNNCPEDIFLWPDGTRCFRSEYEAGHYQMMSDDFEILREGTARHAAVCAGDCPDTSSLETSEDEARPMAWPGLTPFDSGRGA